MYFCFVNLNTNTTLYRTIAHTTTSNKLFTHVSRRTIAHTKELLNTLGGQLRYSNQLSWPTGGKKIAFTGFPWGGISPPGSLCRVFNSDRCTTSSVSVVGIYLLSLEPSLTAIGM